MLFRSHTIRGPGLFLGFLLLLSTPLRGQEPPPVVHAVLFYSPTCPHCHEVINTFLLPLQEEYGNRLVILGMDTSQKWANDLFWETLRRYEVPEDKWAVPFLLVDDTVLVGGFEIPDQFPAILEEGLARGGIDLPDFPALLTFMREQGLLDERYPDRRIALQSSPEAPQETPPQAAPSVADQEASPDVAPPTTDSVGASMAEADTTPPVEDTLPVEAAGPAAQSSTGDPTPVAPDSAPGGEEPTVAGGNATPSLGLAEAARELDSQSMGDRFRRDLKGNTLAVLVLVLMLASLALRGWPPRVKAGPWPGWSVPALVTVGVVVAAYLSYIEITQAEAVCGPVGDCNTVNQSAYATLFGFLPVGVLGLMGYVVLLVLWLLGRSGPADRRRVAHLGFWGSALVGTIFSMYLTFLEPFVIGATCAWCLTSALVMTLLLWAAAPLAAQSWSGDPQ